VQGGGSSGRGGLSVNPCGSVLRLGAARDILDRVGLKAVERHEHSGPRGGPIGIALLPHDEVERRLQEIGAS